MLKLYILTVFEKGRPKQQAVCFTGQKALALYRHAVNTVGEKNVHLNPTRLEMEPLRWLLQEAFGRSCAVVDNIRVLLHEFVGQHIFKEKRSASQDSENLEEPAVEAGQNPDEGDQGARAADLVAAGNR